MFVHESPRRADRPGRYHEAMLDIALKEWAVITDLLLSGELALLLRKGGISEPHGPGRFELEHPRFLLFPSWLHQKPQLLKPTYQHLVRDAGREPGELTLRGWASVDHIWPLRDRASFDQLDDLHPWSPEQIDMRFNYKPHNPLYLMAVRVHTLEQAVTIDNRPEYAGCKSWVNLHPGHAVAEMPSHPVLTDAAFSTLVDRLASVA